MSGPSRDDTSTDSETETDTAVDETEDSDVVVDLDSVEDQDDRLEVLEETVAEQREQIDELEDLLLDLSARSADNGGIGVCPDCHGPVERVRRLFSRSTIECRRCGRVFHEY